MPSVCVILVTWNGLTLTKECLRLLYLQQGVDFRVVLVDNSSSDSTVAWVQQNYPQVQCIGLTDNVGFGRANNIGAQQALQDDVLVFLNNDTRFEQNFLVNLVEHHHAWQNQLHQSLILTPLALNDDGSVQPTQMRNCSPWQLWMTAWMSRNNAGKLVFGNVQPHSQLPALEADGFSAVCWCMDQSTWKNIGGFDANIFMYYEDLDFIWRAQKLGVLFLQDSQTSLIHLGGASAQSSLSRALQHDQSQAYVYAKHFGKSGYWASRLFRMQRSLLRVLFTLPFVLRRGWRANLVLHFALLRNAMRG